MPWTQNDPRQKLREPQVQLILTSNESNIALGKKLGVAPTTISNVRHGRNLSHVLPHLPRREAIKESNPGADCSTCMFFAIVEEDQGKFSTCHLEIPEFKGDRKCRNHHAFARYCNYFQAESKVKD